MKMSKPILAVLLMIAPLQINIAYSQTYLGADAPVRYATEFEKSFADENDEIKYSSKQSYKRTIYVDRVSGDDANRGTSQSSAIRTLEALESISLKPGDQILLKGGQTHLGTVELVDLNNVGSSPIHIGSYGGSKATIDFSGYPTGVTVRNTSNVTITDLKLTANGGPASTNYMYREADRGINYRYAVYVHSSESIVKNVEINNVDIRDVYYFNEDDVNTPIDIRPCRMWSTNGEGQYGWGVKALATSANCGVDGLRIIGCRVEDVSHTGFKLNGRKGIAAINDVLIQDCTLLNTGGPGSQFGGVSNSVMRHCKTVNSGSRSEPRKWGRGSGMWTHSTSNFLFEHNLFEGAQGIADCCGAHIDIGCIDVILQYNVSRNNAGGFVEILGKCQNCCYRYNISIDDGWRNPTDFEQDAYWRWEQHAIDAQGNDMRKIIGKYGALLTVNGFNGGQYVGPFQSYIYNNTIVCSDERADGYTNGHIFEVASSVVGACFVNNLFWIPAQMMYSGSGRFVKDGKNIDNSFDLRKITGEMDEVGILATRDLTQSEIDDLDILIDNNLYKLYDPKFKRGENVLPYDATGVSKHRYFDDNAMGGDPGFKKSSDWKIAEDLVPSNADVINRGVEVKKLKSDKTSYGILPQLTMEYDFFGNPITEPIIGACVVR